MDAIGRIGSRRVGLVAAARRSLEECVTHLRAAGVMQAYEQDLAIGPALLSVGARGRMRDLSPDQLIGESAECCTRERSGEVDPEAPHSFAASAGPSERAGFMDAPVTGPPKSASRATVAPMATAAADPTARTSVATATITNMRTAVRSPS